MRWTEVAAVAEGKAAGAAQAISVLRLLAMAGRDDKTVLVIGDREITVHFLDLRDSEARLSQRLLSVALAELSLPVIDAHGEHTLQRRDHRRLRARCQQIGQIAHRN